MSDVEKVRDMTRDEQLQLWREAMGLDEIALVLAADRAREEQAAAKKSHEALQQRVVSEGVSGLYVHEKDFLRVLSIRLRQLSLRVSVLCAAQSLRELGLRVDGIAGAGGDATS